MHGKVTHVGRPATKKNRHNDNEDNEGLDIWMKKRKGNISKRSDDLCDGKRMKKIETSVKLQELVVVTDLTGMK